MGLVEPRILVSNDPQRLFLAEKARPRVQRFRLRYPSRFIHVVLDYGWNRCLRIFPALWVCLGVSVLSVILAGYSIDFGLTFIVWLATQLLAIPVYNPGFLRDYGTGVLNGSLWTIPVEIQFYASIPFVYWAFGLTTESRSSRRQSWWLFAVIVLLFGLREWTIRLGRPEPTWFSQVILVTLFPYLCIFLLGVLIQRNFERWQHLFTGRAGWWCAAFVIATWGMNALGVTCAGNRLNPASILLLAAVTISTAYTFPGLSARVLRHNDISYGVYIYHMPVINFIIYRGLDGGLLSLLATLAATLILAITSWRLAERPALKLKRRPLRSAS